MKPLRVCLAGTFDPEMPRNRILRELLRRPGYDVTVCHVPLWGRRGHWIVRHGRARLMLRAARTYPRLAARFLAAPRPDVVIVGYPGHFDMPLLAVLARLRGARIVFDSFLSLHDTIVSDRRLVAETSITARLARWIDRRACRLADMTLVDTPENGDDFARRSGLPLDRFRVLPVGADESVFRMPPGIEPLSRRVLFYGTFIPLHGVSTIVRAAERLASEGVAFRIIGTGQERPDTDRLVAALGAANVELLDDVPVDRLPLEIASATLCLGIFGDTDKARRVVPNKVFECLAVGRPVLTADTPAIRGAFADGEVATVPPADPEKLAEAIRDLLSDDTRRERIGRAGHARYRRDYATDELARRLAGHLADVMPPTLRR